MLSVPDIFDQDLADRRLRQRLGREAEQQRSPAKEAAPGDLPADWHFAWDERAATLEHDAGYTREHAEMLALQDVLAQIGRPGVTPGSLTLVKDPAGELVRGIGKKAIRRLLPARREGATARVAAPAARRSRLSAPFRTATPNDGKHSSRPPGRSNVERPQANPKATKGIAAQMI